MNSMKIPASRTSGRVGPPCPPGIPGGATGGRGGLPLQILCGIATIAIVAAGCGYSRPGDPSANSWYQWKSLYREDVQSVAVPIFKNKTYERGVEFSLSKSVVNQIEMRTPYKVMPRERADTILEGEVVAVTRQTLSRERRPDLPQEQLYILRINFVWKDLRSGRILCERRNFEQ